MQVINASTKLPKRKESRRELRLDSVWCERRDLNPYERLMVHKNLNHSE